MDEFPPEAPDVDVDEEEELSFDAYGLFKAMSESTSSESETTMIDNLREIYQSEEVYCEEVNNIVNGYLLPLFRTERIVPCKMLRYLGRKVCDHSQPAHRCKLDSKTKHPVLDRSEISAIFGNIRDVVKVNSTLLSIIRTNLIDICGSKGIENVKVADIVGVYAEAFKHVESYLHVYSLYCSSYQNAQLCLAECESTNDQFAAFVERQHSLGGSGAPRPRLVDLISKPVSRISSYSRLFSKLIEDSRPYVQELVRLFFESEKEIEVITTMTDKIEETHSLVNTMAENASFRVKDDQAVQLSRRVSVNLGDKSLGPNIDAPWRRFLKSAEVMVVDKSESLDPVPMSVYLFTDTLVLAKEKEKLTKAGFLSRSAQMIINSVSPNSSNDASDVSPRRLGSHMSDTGRPGSRRGWSSNGSEIRRVGSRSRLLRSSNKRDSNRRSGRRSNLERRVVGSDLSRRSGSRLHGSSLDRKGGSDLSRRSGSRRGTRAWGSSYSNSSGQPKVSDGGSSRIKASILRSLSRKAENAESEDPMFEVQEKMELLQLKIKPIRKEGELAGVNILWKRREPYDKIIKDKKTGEEKVVKAVNTAIYRFDLLCDNPDASLELLDSIQAQIERLEQQQMEKEKASANFGAKKLTTTRKWANKRRSARRNE